MRKLASLPLLLFLRLRSVLAEALLTHLSLVNTNLAPPSLPPSLFFFFFCIELLRAQQNSSDGLRLGGVLLVSPTEGAPAAAAAEANSGGGRLLFKHLEESVGSLADAEALKAALSKLKSGGGGGAATLVEG